MSYIHANNICLDFILQIQNYSIKKTFIDQLKTVFHRKKQNNSVEKFRALEHISFDLRSGDNIGIIGQNGAGKSTLLRVLSKIYTPTSGSLGINGEVSSLLSMNIGMDIEATGYENIILMGILMGLKRHEILNKIKEIAEFTELGDFLNSPVKNYSSGMLLRLTFATVTSIQPDILLLDEIIGVGDNRFLKKANLRLDSFIKKSNILIIASHDLEVIRNFCNKVLILHKGKALFLGDVNEGIALYLSQSLEINVPIPA